MVISSESRPARPRTEIYGEIKLLKQQLVTIDPVYEEFVDSMVKAFTRSGGEALAHNQKHPVEEHVKPSQFVTMDELLTQLDKKLGSADREISQDESLKAIQTWTRKMNELVRNERTRPLLLRFINLYHEAAGVKPMEDEALDLTFNTVFLTALRQRFGFSF